MPRKRNRGSILCWIALGLFVTCLPLETIRIQMEIGGADSSVRGWEMALFLMVLLPAWGFLPFTFLPSLSCYLVLFAPFVTTESLHFDPFFLPRKKVVRNRTRTSIWVVRVLGGLAIGGIAVVAVSQARYSIGFVLWSGSVMLSALGLILWQADRPVANATHGTI